MLHNQRVYFSAKPLILRNMLSFMALGFLANCGGSILPKGKARPVVAPTPNPVQNPTQSVNPPMTFKPLISEALNAKGGVGKIIFSEGPGANPFESTGAQSLWVFEMQVRSVDVDEGTFENFVKAKLKVSLVVQNKIIATREFESVGNISLKNTGEQDLMLGQLKDISTGSVLLEVNASRVASSTEELALKNAWSGKINFLEAAQNPIELGNIEGHFSGLLPE
jgi:hypothetical protein